MYNVHEFLNGGSFRLARLRIFIRAWSWKIYNEGMSWRIFAKAACPMVVCLLVIEVVQMNFSGLGSRKLSQFPLSFNFQNHIHSNLEWIVFCIFCLGLTGFENCVTFCCLYTLTDFRLKCVITITSKSEILWKSCYCGYGKW